MQVEQQILANVERWLSQHGQTQSWLAQQLDLTPRRLQQYITGQFKLTIDQIASLAKITDQSVSQLVLPVNNSSTSWQVRGTAKTYTSQAALTTLALATQQLHSLQLVERLRHAQ